MNHAALSSEPRATFAPEAVVIVDDDPDYLELLRFSIEELYPDCDVLTFSHGERALEFIADGQVRLLITDLHMPEINGYDLTQRARELKPRLPIVVLTAKDAGVAWPRLRTLGANRCLSKLVGIRKVGAAVEETLSLLS